MLKHFCLAVLLILNIFSQTNSSPEKQQNKNLKLKDYAGDWVGTGWGWEIRFKQTAGEFARQFVKGKVDLPFENEKIIMSLMVVHTTHFYLNIDEYGNVKGKGTISYDLIPNLCGLAALTKQVNERINMLELFPTIFKWAADLGRNAVQNFNYYWYQDQNKLASNIDELESITRRFLYVNPGSKDAELIKKDFLGWIKSNASNDDLSRLASYIVLNRCGSQSHLIGSGLDCADLLVWPLTQTDLEDTELEAWGKMALDEIVDRLLSVLSDKYKEALESISEESEKGEELCRCGAGASVNAGAKYGPTTLEELVLQLGPDVATTLLFDMSLGTPPVGLVMSIPGVTQIQYYYKGLKNGPENRTFDISGKLIEGGNIKLYLEMDGDVKDGDKNLTVEYMVNYKKDSGQFPCWSPFLEDGADVYKSGYETLYELTTKTKVFRIKDKKSGKFKEITVPFKESTKKEVYRDLPFATFRETGTHRNKKSMWHEYEYVWSAYKLTQPIDEEIKEKREEKKRKEKFVKEKTDELKKSGETSLEINFVPGQSSIDPGSQLQIDILAEVIKNFPKDKFTIAACCDTSVNEKLSLSRANSIINLLVTKGIKKSQLKPSECTLSNEDKKLITSENNLCLIISKLKK